MLGHAALAVVDGWLRCGAQRARRDETGAWVAGETGQTAWQRFRVAAPSKALPQPFENEQRTTIPAVPAPLIERYGEVCTQVRSHPALPYFALPSPSLRPRALQAISRRLSRDCSISHAKWNNLVIIARSEGCHRCRPNHQLSAKEASNFSAPMPVVRRYLLE